MKPTFVIPMLLCLLASALFAQDAKRTVVDVTDAASLSAALRSLAPGTTVRVAPGEYRGTFSLVGAQGTREAPLEIVAADPEKPPVIVGEGEGIKISDCAYLRLRGFVVKGARNNGVNIDDGGTFETPAHHLIVEDVAILQTGPTGNHDALKLSGVDHFIVRRCRFEGWGGSGIDMVGCHQGLIEDCRFIGLRGFRQANGVQIKGGSSNILVQTSFFKDAGFRGVNVGGATGLKFFRPQDAEHEARDVTVAGNRFAGCETPVAWVGSRNTIIRNNLFWLPGKHVVRILQENAEPRLTPCRDGTFENNVSVFADSVRYVANVGPGTKPRTFLFRRNAWHRYGRGLPPILPTTEADRVEARDPDVKDPYTETMRIGSTDKRFSGIGPDAYERFKPGEDFGDLAVPDVPAPDLDAGEATE